MRILIVGGDSLIGGSLISALRAEGHEVVATSRRTQSAGADLQFLDLEAAVTQAPVLPQVEAAVICAARARLTDCVEDPAGSRRVNVDGAGAVARELTNAGAYTVFLSSDKVFDGLTPQRRRDDATRPKTEYGRQKADAEAAILSLGDNAAVLRLCKVLDPSLALLSGWAATLSRGQPIDAYRDMYLAPVSTAFVCQVVAALLIDRKPGIYHCTGAEDRPYLAVAEAMADAVGASRGLLRPRACDPEAHPPEARPPHSTLEMNVERYRYGLSQPAFEQTMEEVCSVFRSR